MRNALLNEGPQGPRGLGRPLRRALVPALAAVVALTGLSGTTLAAGPPATPAGEVFVVTANLQEAFNREDYRNLSEMRVFVKRLPLGVDLIFTIGGMRNAGGDVKNPPVFYSDHRFFWANLLPAP